MRAVIKVRSSVDSTNSTHAQGFAETREAFPLLAAVALDPPHNSSAAAPSFQKTQTPPTQGYETGLPHAIMAPAGLLYSGIPALTSITAWAKMTTGRLRICQLNWQFLNKVFDAKR